MLLKIDFFGGVTRAQCSNDWEDQTEQAEPEDDVALPDAAPFPRTV